MKEGSNRLKKIERQAFGMAGEVLVQMDDDNSGQLTMSEFESQFLDESNRVEEGDEPLLTLDGLRRARYQLYFDSGRAVTELG